MYKNKPSPPKMVKLWLTLGPPKLDQNQKILLDSFKPTPRLMRGGLRLFFFEKHVFVKQPSVHCVHCVHCTDCWDCKDCRDWDYWESEKVRLTHSLSTWKQEMLAHLKKEGPLLIGPTSIGLPPTGLSPFGLKWHGQISGTNKNKTVRYTRCKE